MTTPQLTGNLSTLTDYYYEFLKSNKTSLGIQDVYWGDQAKFPRTPSVCVEPQIKTNVMMNGGRRFMTPDITVVVIVYDDAVGSTQRNARDALLLVENVETLIHTKPTAGGLVINAYVETIEAGYAEKANGVLRAARLVINAKSRFDSLSS